MKVVYTKHAAVDKFNMLKKHKFHVNKNTIEKVIKDPDHEDRKSDQPKIIASKDIDQKHVLRVVYKREGDIMTIITFYPAEKGRYY